MICNESQPKRSFAIWHSNLYACTLNNETESFYFKSELFSPGNSVYMKSQFALPQQTNKTDSIAKQHVDISFHSHLQDASSPQFLPGYFSHFPAGKSLQCEPARGLVGPTQHDPRPPRASSLLIFKAVWANWSSFWCLFSQSKSSYFFWLTLQLRKK